MLNNMERIEALKAYVEVITNAYDHDCIERKFYTETIKDVAKQLQDMLKKDYLERKES